MTDEEKLRILGAREEKMWQLLSRGLWSPIMGHMDPLTVIDQCYRIRFALEMEKPVYSVERKVENVSHMVESD